MFNQLLAQITARTPSALRKRMSAIRPLYTYLMRIGEPVIQAQTIAGPLNWKVDNLMSQEFVLGTYEPYMQRAFSRYIEDSFIVYDVGAHAGYHSLVCSLLTGPLGRVIAFEPNPDNRESIERQLEANPALPVTLLPYALGDRCGTGKLNTSLGGAQGFISAERGLSVDVRTIDYLITNERIPKPDLIKLDVEGLELEVLSGAVETIKKYRPIILCDRNDDTTRSKLTLALASNNYSVTDEWPITALPL